MSRIAVYTCILNQWDHLRPPDVAFGDANFICYTNRHVDPCYPWEFQPAYELTGNPARDSRLPKMLPHLHFDAEYSIWHDGNFTLRMDPWQVIEQTIVTTGADLAFFAHPCRHNVAEECDTLLNEKIGNASEVMEQRTRWKHHGSPEGLWAGGFIVRRHCAAVSEFNIAWWTEFFGGSTRDQLALPLAVQKISTYGGLHTIAGNVYDNPYIAMHWHAAWKHKAENLPFQERAAVIEARREILRNLCQR